MAHKTPLYQAHLNAGAKMIDFSGWDMPIHYGSQLEEHKQVRQDAGMFDVSHMTIIDIHGNNAKTFLRYLLANDVTKLKEPGKALYSCMLNTKGGVIDDLICYYFQEDFYRLVVNAATREKDLAWLLQQAKKYNLDVKERKDLAMVAVQGPSARGKVDKQFPIDIQVKLQALKPFQSLLVNDWQIARTGYTGEDGYELLIPQREVVDFWQTLLQAGVKPCGLGARDTLRLEAGLNLYGQDMDETTSPLISNLAWTVAFEPTDRDFIGKKALLAEKQQGITSQLVGLVLKDRGVLRSHTKVKIANGEQGETTSGSFSPTLGKAIALARIPITQAKDCLVEIRGKWLPATIVKLPFVRYGEILV